jgi:hypothetical protein
MRLRAAERPAHRFTTRHAQAIYPFTAAGGLGGEGVFIGRDASGGAFCFDPWVLYQQGVLDDPNAIVLGSSARARARSSRRFRAAAEGRPAPTATESQLSNHERTLLRGSLSAFGAGTTGIARTGRSLQRVEKPPPCVRKGVDEPKRSTLESLRGTILEIVPDAEQVISYRVPAFRVGGQTVAGGNAQRTGP